MPAVPAIDHPSAWTSAAIGGKEGLIHRLSDAQLEAIYALAIRIADKPLVEITRADVDDPELVTLMTSVRFDIQRGKAATVLSGVEIGGMSEAVFHRVFWALGTHLGEGAVQSARRDLVGRVEKLEDNPAGRGYQSDIELGSHCDFHEILALASYRAADEGGLSGLVSSLAVHDIMQAEHPDLLAALYRGFRHQCASPEDLSDENIPVFCDVEGKISCFYHGLFMMNAAKTLGTPLPADLIEAQRVFNEIALRPDVKASFLLEPGEMVFWHNFVCLHSRTSFKDRSEHRRLLFRLWLHAQPGESRAMHPAFVGRARQMDAVHQQGKPALVYNLGELIEAQR